MKLNKTKEGGTACLKIKIQEVTLIKYLMIELFITEFNASSVLWSYNFS